MAIVTTKHKDASRRNCDLDGYVHAEALYVNAVLSETKGQPPGLYYSFGFPALANSLRILRDMGIVTIKIDLGNDICAKRSQQKSNPPNAM